MALLALLVFVFVRSQYPAVTPASGWDPLTLVGAAATLATYGLLLLGAHVRATGTSLAFPDWPLMNGMLLPGGDPTVLPHVIHRWAAVVVAVVVVWFAWLATTVSSPAAWLARLAAVLFGFQIAVGGIQVLTGLAPWALVLHVALGAGIFGLLVGAWLLCLVRAGAGSGRGDLVTAFAEVRANTWESIRTYVALTKPRIIELLLVTTVPTMVLAQGGLPSPWLVLAVMIGGTLAAGGANAMNQYFDRDIDDVMRRTRNRPLPRHAVSPRSALVFGFALSIISFVWLAVTVNLLSAALAASAIAFYVVVYTLWLKRTTPRNIVIGGAAGCVPVLVAWAAVTGTVELPALVLFAIVFYWTPPHFWALALRYRSDYEAAGVPMLPVVVGEAETARQIVIYTLILVAVSLLLVPVAGMSLLYLVAAARARGRLPGDGLADSPPPHRRPRRHQPVPILGDLPDAAVRGGRPRSAGPRCLGLT